MVILSICIYHGQLSGLAILIGNDDSATQKCLGGDKGGGTRGGNSWVVAPNGGTSLGGGTEWWHRAEWWHQVGWWQRIVAPDTALVRWCHSKGSRWIEGALCQGRPSWKAA